MTTENKQASASKLIDERIRDLDDWRGETLARMRSLILEAEPDIVEEWKWMGTPVWSLGGIVSTGEVYKNVVKLTFARGASLPDPTQLFNSSLEGNTRRAIDIHEGEQVNARAFKALVKAAVAFNLSTKKKKASKAKKPAKSTKSGTGKKSAKVVLLSGGNPQIAKGDGNGPVQRYIAAMPGWKRGVGEHLDRLIERTVPKVQKAVKWNSPFYGVEGNGYFLSFHVFTRYVKVTWFRGTSLKPMPPGASKDKHVRYLDIHEDDEIDDAQLKRWIKQAAAEPGYLAP